MREVVDRVYRERVVCQSDVVTAICNPVLFIIYSDPHPMIWILEIIQRSLYNASSVIPRPAGQGFPFSVLHPSTGIHFVTVIDLLTLASILILRAINFKHAFEVGVLNCQAIAWC